MLHTTQKKRIAIIGGGPGGLFTAYYLQKELTPECDFTIFEAGPRLGGKVVTRRFESEDVSYEAGAAELYDYSQLGPDPLRELVAELGLATRPMSGDTVVLDNHILETYRDIRRAFGDATVAELKRFLRRARAAISPAEYYESDWKEDNESILSQRSFRALLDTIADERARDYVRVAVHSDLATEPHLTSAMYGLQNYLMNEPEYLSLYTIEGGLERLPRELAKRLTARILLNRPVTRVEATAGGTYRITSRHDGDTAIEEFDVVVAALPNNWLPAIDWRGASLRRAMERHHARYDYPAHYLRVSVLFNAPFWRPRLADSYFMLDAFGGCCVYDESARGNTGTRGVLGWLLAGDAAATLANLDRESLVAAVLDSLPAELGNPRAHFKEARVHRWLGSVNGLPAGKTACAPEARHRPDPDEHPRLFVVGDYLFDSTLNGVLDSAELVADLVERELIGTPLAMPALAVHGSGDVSMAGIAACAGATS